MPSALSQALGGVGGGLALGSVGRASGLGGLLDLLDSPRQALWNLVRSGKRAITGEGSWDDLLSAVPGALGAGLAGGLMATGVGAPLGVLAGSLLGGGAQALGSQVKPETFKASSPADVVGDLGIDPSSVPGMAASFGLGMATDPLTFAGGLGGARIARGAESSAMLRRPLGELTKGEWGMAGLPKDVRPTPTWKPGQPIMAAEVASPLSRLEHGSLPTIEPWKMSREEFHRTGLAFEDPHTYEMIAKNESKEAAGLAMKAHSIGIPTIDTHQRGDTITFQMLVSPDAASDLGKLGLSVEHNHNRFGTDTFYVTGDAQTFRRALEKLPPQHAFSDSVSAGVMRDMGPEAIGDLRAERNDIYDEFVRRSPILKSVFKGTPTPTWKPGQPIAKSIETEAAANPRSLLVDPPENNYRTDLGTYTKKLYHETSLDEAELFLPNSQAQSGHFPGGRLFTSNVPELATGQGVNKGVMLEFDAPGIEGQINQSKPAWEMSWKGGDAAEFFDTHGDYRPYRQNLRSVTVDPTAQVGGQGQRMRMLRRFAELQAENGWQRVKNADGSITYLRQKAGQ